MSLLGGIIGGVLKPATELGETALRERGETSRAQDLNLTAREQIRLSTTLSINAGASTWRPKWMHAIRRLLMAYFTLSFVGACVTAVALASVFLEYAQYSQWATIRDELEWFLGAWVAMGGSLITVATWSFLGYSPFRSIYDKSGSGVVKPLRDLVRRVMPELEQRREEVREVIREDLDVSPDEIERIPGIRLAETSRPLNASQLKRIAKEIRKDEGYRLAIYRDTKGNPTVGIGHLIKPGDPEHGKPVGYEITRERVQELFNQDFRIAYDDAQAVVSDFHSLPVEARAVLINMCFQMGRERVLGFELMLEAVQDRDWISAGEEARDSKWWLIDTRERAERMAQRLEALDA